MRCNIVVAIVLLSVMYLAGVSAGKIAVTDPNIYWTSYNWYIPADGSYALTNNVGAYFKVGFTGTSFALIVDVIGAPATAYMTLKYSVDGGSFAEITLPQSSPLYLSSGLAQGNHTVFLIVKNSLSTVDRWLKPQNHLTINGFSIDDGASLYPYPDIQPKRMLVYAASIGEGYHAISCTGNDLVDGDSTESWLFAMGTSMVSEVSIVSFAGQGFTKSGAGNVPPFMNLSDPQQSTWSNYFQGQSRLVNGLFDPQPDMIVIGLGVNDAFSSDASVTASVSAFLSAVRLAAGNNSFIYNNTYVLITVPFSRTKADAITNAFNNYDAGGDGNTFLLDLGPFAAVGVDQWPKKSLFSCDGLHPSAERAGQLGGMMGTAGLWAIC